MPDFPVWVKDGANVVFSGFMSTAEIYGDLTYLVVSHHVDGYHSWAFDEIFH